MARAIDPTVGDGLLVVDKPAGWTSHQVVGACRRLAGTRKVGHAGTLDPMATGVLVVGINKGTRLLTYLVGADKDYTATIRLGVATLTDDAEGQVTGLAPSAAVAAVTEAELAAAIASLTGDIQQVPSAVSALKIDGKRSYARVRAGESVELAARPVTVSRFEVLARRNVTVQEGELPECVQEGELPEGPDPIGAPVIDLDVAVTVSSGTYVRALARDLGEALRVGGHLSALRRTRVGGITLQVAHTMEQLEAARATGAPRPQTPQELATAVLGTSGLPLTPLADAARAALPARELTDEEAYRVGHGVRIPSAKPGRIGPVAAFAPDGTFVAVLDESRERVLPEAVFAVPPASA
ncbi:tRNA pseudouridine55 synthase [Kineosphaera limosa]|uniref:tRNA pseudouridine synthase B n=1 Tax=Kineosphaera limosa NBRC 100340 TaxID=1184609 RepID=K6WT70_9MICO|nr:tRNA pseudouridine(55) synthase TruB [Kineosphaera limosa]NYD99314.1 tRNA pseudouridine55 synthase [Kineosphaera limosa]GAB97036.1 tRNA pseudouridine synthase B [Kineosphaera limosa NBRC 100340]